MAISPTCYAAANPALEFIWRIGEGAFGEKSVSDVIADHAEARVANAAVDYDDPAGSSSPPAPPAARGAVLTHARWPLWSPTISPT